MEEIAVIVYFLIGSTLWKTNRIWGTPSYFALELIARKSWEYDEATELSLKVCSVIFWLPLLVCDIIIFLFSLLVFTTRTTILFFLKK